jgi:pimeloyl-ACP methyl ester carboxylesterase
LTERFLDSGEGRRLGFARRPGRGPTLLFLPGYRSDMAGGKATALDAWAASEGRAMLRFDYGGCGASAGGFEAQTLADWLGDALAMIDRVAQGPLVLVGSSMGGWLMLLAALARPERIAALVGIAVAPDFTDWGFTDAQKAALRRDGRLEEPSPYGEPSVTTRAFWESGERLKLPAGELPIDAPVRLLHGLDDEDVPWRISLDLLERLRTADARLTLVKGGDHRLSREPDIALLIDTVREVIG